MRYRDAARLMRGLDRSGEHWLWTGSKRGGYGQMSVVTDRGSRPLLTHRLSYELHVGAVPDGLTLDHLCRVRACARPDHLEAVSNAENILRGESPPARNARRLTCRLGHPLTRASRGRRCQTCHKAYMVRWHEMYGHVKSA